MGPRKLGRAVVFIGVAAIIARMAWWANYFNLVFRGLGSTPPWGLCFFAIALRGGGPYSLDRLLGREF
jgi:hypothetical protein